FHVGPARAGLTISAVVIAIAVGVWLWGPLSDRIGRRRSIVLASALLVVPTVAAGLAPSFGALLACRAAQGLCMPGLLAVGVPYVGVFSYVVYGLRRPPFELGPAVRSLIFVLWLLGAVGPYAGKLADRIGWRRAAFASVACAGVGLALSFPATLPTLALGLSLLTVAMFAGVTALQLGVTRA